MVGEPEVHPGVQLPGAAFVDTPFRDFVSRGLVAGDHYWPIDPKNKCPAIKFAVDWGNDHAVESERMAKEGSGIRAAPDDHGLCV
ncbi:hypothetical protein PR202_gb29097 [Eleusine coracana subsp. coracana]|uniref:Glycosyl transferase CAP10 domain-containing protein n=1 Tax=Eleusine coracana subsp. coracana TaxID=191504 RepID=A0AAV5FW66_ELECO|nr:hypothetical protein PR202_gb29097 [Eleusine coracana subsp. coracana]